MTWVIDASAADLATLVDARHLCAAEGYAELGMFEEAESEITAMRGSWRNTPQIRALRTVISNRLRTLALLQRRGLKFNS